MWPHLSHSLAPMVIWQHRGHLRMSPASSSGWHVEEGGASPAVSAASSAHTTGTGVQRTGATDKIVETKKAKWIEPRYFIAGMTFPPGRQRFTGWRCEGSKPRRGNSIESLRRGALWPELLPERFSPPCPPRWDWLPIQGAFVWLPGCPWNKPT